jgi:hypothetical protein
MSAGLYTKATRDGERGNRTFGLREEDGADPNPNS